MASVTSKTQMFQSECEYKGTHPFQRRFMVIDARLKILRIYKNEQELRDKDKNKNKNIKRFKEIALESANIDSSLHRINDKPNCIKIHADYTRYFHFNDKITAQSALNFLEFIISSKKKDRYSPISVQIFQFRCLFCSNIDNKLTDFMMAIDIKNGRLMLCSLDDGYCKIKIKLKNSEISNNNKINSNSVHIKDKPNITIIVKNIYYTFWFYDLNAMKSALMCIQRIQKPIKLK